MSSNSSAPSNCPNGWIAQGTPYSDLHPRQFNVKQICCDFNNLQRPYIVQARSWNGVNNRLFGSVWFCIIICHVSFSAVNVSGNQIYQFSKPEPSVSVTGKLRSFHSQHCCAFPVSAMNEYSLIRDFLSTF